MDKIPPGHLESWYSWMTFVAIVLPLIGGIAGWAAWKLDDRIDEVKQASDKEKDESFQLKIATLDKEAGEARKQAAVANERAVVLESDLLRLRSSVEWRSFSSNELKRGIELLSPYSGTCVFQFATAGDPESRYFVEKLQTLLASSGWNVTNAPVVGFFTGSPTGVQIKPGSTANKPAAATLASFLKSIGINAYWVEPRGTPVDMSIDVLPKSGGK